MITVKELIESLKDYPQDLLVVYSLYSEQILLEEDDLEVEELCLPRNDGWVANKRPDKPRQNYLVLP